MTRLMTALGLAILATGPALADECKDKAVDSNGKRLAGAALASHLKTCRHDACDAKAVIGADGRKFTGAAYNSFIAKCEKEAARGR
jgi:hypothetical protein